MQIRCGSCHGAVWLEPAEMIARQVRLTCPTCGKEYSLEGGAEAHKACDRLASEARQLARETQLDLPSAYSVLLGVMTLEEVLELGNDSSPACRTAPEEPSTSPGKALVYDPAFKPAVDEGLLTPIQAMQRGKRQGYASIAAKRFRLTEALALDVADNRISLLEAIRKRGPDPGPQPVKLKEERSRLGWLFATLGVVVVVLVVVVYARGVGTSDPTVPTGSRQRTVLGAEIRSDEWGRLLEIAAPDPKTVLASFCVADRERRYEPVDIALSATQGPQVRLGLVRRTGRSGELLAIEIREDRARNRWVAGDGQKPVVPRTAPAAATRGVPAH